MNSTTTKGDFMKNMTRIFKAFMRRKAIMTPYLVSGESSSLVDEEPMQKYFRKTSEDSGIVDDNENDERAWRFIVPHFMNDTLLRFSEIYTLESMERVEGVLSRAYANYRKEEADHVSYDDIRLVLFIDIDNWGRFFKLPALLPPKTYVLCLKGGANRWKPPENLDTYTELHKNNMVYLSKDVGTSKDAADFALTFQCGKLHSKLPLHVGFLIVSGDYGITEILKQMKGSKRLVGFVNPHQKKGNLIDRHYEEKLEDDEHLLDIIRIMNYFSLIAETKDEEVRRAEHERAINCRNQVFRLSNKTIE